MEKYITPIQIRFNDIDMVGHVNNVIFGHYCDIARYQFMQDRLNCPPDLLNDNRILILVHTEFDFLHPSTIKDSLHVETSIEHIGQKSVHLYQEIVDQNGTVKACSHSVMSTFDKTTGKSFPLPQDWVTPS